MFLKYVFKVRIQSMTSTVEYGSLDLSYIEIRWWHFKTLGSEKLQNSGFSCG